MRVCDLIRKLTALPQGVEIVMSCDAEGNHYHHIDEVFPPATKKAGEGFAVCVIYPKHESIEEME
jgi:hypothetical protein